MNKISTPHIIGISGNMGAGKTTLTLELASYLHSPFISWDDFDEISNGPEDYIDWYKRGENYTEWDYPKLAEVLKVLKSGEAVIHPVKNSVVNPKQYIIFDAPLGRFHQQTGIYIDTWIHINVPLDVSLCRWVLRNYKNTDKTKEDLLDELEFYLSESRPLFEDREFKSKADFIINGMDSTKHQVELIREYLGI
ncbi:uridine kinase [Legionella bozemanae]|uniref:Uridine kinase n=1 Tax=Legionella bozemanae TaxID=447 RepID=A0A0W0R9W2_LEGBO|nr:uridine kinase [Legionella bozemanae]HCJ1077173.1 uridine kinase [Legionella pneumophila]KTC67854.1 uridine kinase [Legionella bozemanae]STP10067.1 uridine kinase [Legionella bozemanae]STP13945.1 uridine kinase [Legionella bozemanae]STP13993.1 uridine kinase [Legionella bozemanae]